MWFSLFNNASLRSLPYTGWQGCNGGPLNSTLNHNGKIVSPSFFLLAAANFFRSLPGASSYYIGSLGAPSYPPLILP